ncbi:MAG: BREX system ATP-binding domain-containing protein, partial [Thermodesulfobacteriota bacterium]|nr:BREX system ATP-binding domain-containing protein [Thermodesulfobacteriota bacterium]
SKEQINTLAETLRNLPDMNVNFANGLISLVKNRFAPLQEGEQEEERIDNRETLFHWFEAGKITKRELKPFSIFEVVNKANSKQMLNSLNSFLRFCGHKGVVLLLDELETVIVQATSIRNAAWENVRLLIDNTEQASYFHIFFAIIPEVLLSEKGFKSYDALWSRVRSIGQQEQRLNYRGVLVDLHRTPLTPDELVKLGQSLRQIHQISYRWDATDSVPDKLLLDICANQKKMGLLSEVRLFVKQVIRLLDMAEQGEDVSNNLDLDEHIVSSQQELEQEKVEKLQPSWDN